MSDGEQQGHYQDSSRKDDQGNTSSDAGDNDNESGQSKKFVPISGSASTLSLHVGNMKYETTEETLRHVFEKYGKVNGVNIVKNQNGTSKGHAFVDMASEQDAKSAIEGLNKTDLDGREITVAFKKSQDELYRDRQRRGGDRYDRNDDHRGNRGSSYRGGDRRGGYNDRGGGGDEDRYSRRSSYRDGGHRSSSSGRSRHYEDDSPPRHSHRSSRSPSRSSRGRNDYDSE